MQQFKCIGIGFFMIVSTEYVLAMHEGNKSFVNLSGVEARKPFTPFSDAIANSMKNMKPVVVDGGIAVPVINHESSKLNIASQPVISHEKVINISSGMITMRENSENKSAPQSEKISNVDSSKPQWMHDYPELSLIDEAPYDNSISGIDVNNNISVSSEGIVSLDDANKLIQSLDQEKQLKGYNARIVHNDTILNQENNIIYVNTEALAKEKNLSNRVNLQKKIATAKSAYNIAEAQKKLDNLHVEILKYIEENKEIVKFYEGPQKDNIEKAIESRYLIEYFTSKAPAADKQKAEEQIFYNKMLSEYNLTDEQITKCIPISDYRYQIKKYEDALSKAVTQSKKQEAQQLKSIAQVQVFVNEIFNLLSLYISDAAAFARIKAELVADAMPTWVKSWSDVSFFNWIFKFQRVQHYKTLGLKLSADKDTIKKAYKNLALQYHPDKFKSKLSPEDAATMTEQDKKDFIAQEKQENAKKMLAIQEAYNILIGKEA